MLVPPSIYFSGDKVRATSLKSKALKFYSFITTQAEIGGVAYISRSLPLEDGSLIKISSFKEGNYNLRTGHIIIFGVAEDIVQAIADNVFICYPDRTVTSLSDMFIYPKNITNAIKKNTFFGGHNSWISSKKDLSTEAASSIKEDKCISWFQNKVYITGVESELEDTTWIVGSTTNIQYILAAALADTPALRLVYTDVSIQTFLILILADRVGSNPPKLQIYSVKNNSISPTTKLAELAITEITNPSTFKIWGFLGDSLRLIVTNTLPVSSSETPVEYQFLYQYTFSETYDSYVVVEKWSTTQIVIEVVQDGTGDVDDHTDTVVTTLVSSEPSIASIRIEENNIIATMVDVTEDSSLSSGWYLQDVIDEDTYTTSNANSYSRSTTMDFKTATFVNNIFTISTSTIKSITDTYTASSSGGGSSTFEGGPERTETDSVTSETTTIYPIFFDPKHKIYIYVEHVVSLVSSGGGSYPSGTRTANYTYLCTLHLINDGVDTIIDTYNDYTYTSVTSFAIDNHINIPYTPYHIVSYSYIVGYLYTESTGYKINSTTGVGYYPKTDPQSTSYAYDNKAVVVGYSLQAIGPVPNGAHGAALDQTDWDSKQGTLFLDFRKYDAAIIPVSTDIQQRLLTTRVDTPNTTQTDILKVPRLTITTI